LLPERFVDVLLDEPRDNLPTDRQVRHIPKQRLKLSGIPQHVWGHLPANPFELLDSRADFRVWDLAEFRCQPTRSNCEPKIQRRANLLCCLGQPLCETRIVLASFCDSERTKRASGLRECIQRIGCTARKDAFRSGLGCESGRASNAPRDRTTATEHDTSRTREEAAEAASNRRSGVGAPSNFQTNRYILACFWPAQGTNGLRQATEQGGVGEIESGSTHCPSAAPQQTTRLRAAFFLRALFDQKCLATAVEFCECSCTLVGS
jgi:hypothetical protein